MQTDIFIALLGALFFGLAGVLFKLNQVWKGDNATFLSGLYISGATGFLLQCLFQQTLFLDFNHILAGAVIAAGSSFGNFYYLKALHYGPVSLTAGFVNFNLVLIIACAFVFLGEVPSLGELSGITGLVIALIVASYTPGEKWKVESKLWVILLGLSVIFYAIRNGGLKFTATLSLDNTAVLLIAYIISLTWFSSVKIKERLQAGTSTSTSTSTFNFNIFYLGLIAGVGSYLGLEFYGQAIAIGEASIIAPTFSTYAIFIAVGSIIFLNERLNGYQIVAFLLTIVSLIVLLRAYHTG